MTDNKVIIVGGGHNGLVCAAYLAKAGRKVTVLEAAGQVGGAAVTREFAPGYKVSACAHLLFMLDPEISGRLGLEQHGLQLAAADLETVSLSPTGQHLFLSGSRVRGGDLGPQDAARLKLFHQRMLRFAGVLRKVYTGRPPRLLGQWSELKGLGKLGLAIRGMGRDDMREFLRIAGINIYDILQEQFDSEMLKGALAWDSVLGGHLGPRSNNSVLNYLHRLTGEVNGKRGAMASVKGGMGGVTRSLAGAATAAGVDIRTSAVVSRIVLDGGVVTGVELQSGEKLSASTVVSNADPRTTFMNLVGLGHLEAGVALQVRNIRARGSVAKLHLALDELPAFKGLERDALGGRLLISPSMAELEQAFDFSKYGEVSESPMMEITLPTVHDPELAPAGKHVLSALVQYAPYRLKQGWDTGRKQLQQRAMSVLERYAPGIGATVLHSEILSPADIESEFRIAGGHWHHGEFALDQFMMTRPFYGSAQYASPLPGLYLCGAGSHPGGGVMGSAGRNAANEILARGDAV
jgi:phytoene dehydrogenase-like protein